MPDFPEIPHAAAAPIRHLHLQAPVVWLVHEEATNWAKLVEGKRVPEAGVCRAPLDPWHRLGERCLSLRDQPCLPGHMPVAVHSPFGSQPWLPFRGLGAPPTSHHTDRMERPLGICQAAKSPHPSGLLAPVFPAEPLLQRGDIPVFGCFCPMGQLGCAKLQTCRNGHSFIWVQSKEKLHGLSETIPDRDWCAFWSL